MTRLKELERWRDQVASALADRGLDVPETKIRLMYNDDLARFIARAGFPERYRHFSIYQAYLLLRRRRLRGMSLSEHVTNTTPHIIPVAARDARAMQYLLVANGVARAAFMQMSEQFAETRPDDIVYLVRNHAQTVEQMLTGPDADEPLLRDTLTAAHAIRLVRDYPLSRDGFSLLTYIAEHSPDLTDWQRELLFMVERETRHFAPHIGTRVLMAGFGAYWQMQMLEQLLSAQDPDLYDAAYLAHVRSVRRFPDYDEGERLNPHLIGEMVVTEAMRQSGGMLHKSLFAENDVTFLRNILSEQLVARLGLIREVTMPEQFETEYAGTPFEIPAHTPFVLDVADEIGWEIVRDVFLMRLGFGWWPAIRLSERSYPAHPQAIMLRHSQDIGELDADEAKATIAHVQTLWGKGAVIQTFSQSDNDTVYYICDQSGKTERKRKNPPKQTRSGPYGSIM